MYFFDVCGTLYDTNTTYGFIRYYHLSKRNWVRFFVVVFFMSFFGKVLDRFFGVSVRALLIKTLKGASCGDLEEVADIYVDWVLKGKEIPIIFSVFYSLVSRDSSFVFLVSASIDPVIKSIAKKYKVNFYSSRLEYVDGISTGRLFIDLKGNKDSIIKVHDSSASIFYTDNADDIACAILVNKLHFIVRGNGDFSSKVLPSNVELICV